MYKIWELFSEETRRRVAEKEYTILYIGGVGLPAPRYKECCPLGVALDIEYPRPAGSWYAPFPFVVSNVFGESGRGGPIYRAADEFMDDFDHGRVTDLREAVGIE